MVFARSPAQRLAWLGFFTLVVVAHNPQRLLHPVLYAEDGTVFFQQAYMQGWRALLLPHVGYIDLLNRLAAAAGLLLHLTDLPAFFQALGLAAQMLPVPLLLWRGAAIVPSAAARLALCLFYVAMPQSEEIHLCLTNAQWHLALMCFLLLVLPPPAAAWARAGDAALMLLGGLTGPFALPLAPVAAWRWLRGNHPPAARRMALLVLLCAAMQAAMIAFGPVTRSKAELGVSLGRLVRLLADQVVVAGTLGVWTAVSWHQLGVVTRSAGAVAILCVAAAIVLQAVRLGGPVLTQFLVFGGLVLAAGLASPLVGVPPPPLWDQLDWPFYGERYFYLAVLGWFTAVLSLTARHTDRWGGFALLALFPIGMARDFEYSPPPLAAARLYHDQAKAFAHAPPGTMTSFVEYQRNWTMTLTKH